MKTFRKLHFLLGLTGLFVAVPLAQAQSDITVSSSNGQTIVTWHGQQVFSGPTRGAVRGLSINQNGEEYAAAFDGDTVLWENISGAAEKLKSSAPGPKSGGKRGGAKSKTIRSHSLQHSESTVLVSTVNGQTTVTWNGQQVFSGPTQSRVTSRSKNVDGTEYAAVFDGDTVIWENVKGAAEKVK